MQTRLFLPVLFISSVLFQGVGIDKAEAMPMFARKYSVQCATCHAVVPRLNFVGNKFKAAGYRMPWEVAKDQNDSVLKLENYTSFVSELNAPLSIQVDHASQNTTTNLSVSDDEIDVHPITGSYGKYWGSGFELDAFSTGGISVNQGFITFTDGTADSFGTVQVGVVPNFPVFGILHPPVGVSAPLVLSTSASNPELDTLFNWTDPRAAGLTASYWLGDTYVSASVRNRLLSTPDGLDALNGTKKMGDIFLSATQYLDHIGSGSALSIFYYKGLSQVPTTLDGSALYGDSFNHLGFAVNKYISDRYNLFGGAGWNADQSYDPTNGSTDQTLHSYGVFAGIEEFWNPQLMAGIRLDQFRSDSSLPDSTILGGSAYGCWHVIDWIILSAELQYLHNEMNTSVPVGVNGGLGSVDQIILNTHATVTF